MTSKTNQTSHFRVFPAEFHGTKGVVAYGYLQVPFEYNNGAFNLVLPADQLREIFSAYDQAKGEASKEAAEAVFKPTTPNTNKEED
ncbi:hypothetical protein NBRC116602_07050 [Hyphomicrobiales bacterium 4NK60-0047b]